MKREYKLLTALVISGLMGFCAMPAEAAVTVTGETSVRTFTGNSDTDSANGNTISMKDATLTSGEYAFLYGGYAESGTADNNTVSISGDTGFTSQGLSLSVFGGQVDDVAHDASASGNTVTVTLDSSAKLSGQGMTIYGGNIGSGNGSPTEGVTYEADNNTVTMNVSTTSDAVYSVFGGNSMGGSSSGNTVTITDEGSGTYFGVGGGKTTGEATSDVCGANDNTVSIKGKVTLVGWTFGGSATSGNADRNSLYVENTTGGALYGGVAAGDGADVSNNTVEAVNATPQQAFAGYAPSLPTYTVTLDDNTLTLTNSSVSSASGGAFAYNGSAEGNTVTMSNSTVGSSEVSASVFGALLGKGTVTDNTVNMRKGSTVSETISGGSVITGTSSGNTVNVDDGSAKAIYGGSTGPVVTGMGIEAIGYYFITDETTTGDATGNTVNFKSGTAEAAAGGYTSDLTYTNASGDSVTLTSGNASGNTLNLSGGTISGNAYGGYSESGDAAGNTLTAAGSSTVTGSAYGGFTAKGSASDNVVTVTGGDIGSDGNELTGGRALVGEASGNSVTIEDGNFALVNGGATGPSATETAEMPEITDETTTGNATGNTVTIKGGTIVTAAGGRTGELSYTKTDGSSASLLSGDTIGNSIVISGGQVTAAAGGYGGEHVTDNTAEMTGGSVGTLAGGTTETGIVSGNSVTLSGGTASVVVGGETINVGEGGKVLNNSVSVSGGEITMAVAGGTAVEGDVTGNTLTISGGTIGNEESSGGMIAGGYAVDGAAKDNTVTITGGTLGVLMSLYGGYSESESSGNTLNLYTKGNTVSNLSYFQTLNFYVPEGTTAGETMIEVTDTADVSGAAIYAGVEDTTKLSPGEVINLIHDANNPIATEGTTYSMMAGKDVTTDASFLQRKVYIKKQDDNTIVLYIPEDSQPFLNPDTKLLPEDRINAINTVKNAGDIVTDGAWNAAEGAWLEDHEVEAKFVPYAVVGGYDLHYDTGSFIDSNGMAANVGFVRRNQHEGHIDTIMPFLEYGKSHYASYLDDGARGDGRQHYTGGGILLRRDLTDGRYYEGAVRAGYLKGDFHGIIANAMTRYDSGAPYLAAQAGLGKIFAKDRDTYDVYGKFFYTHLASDSTVITSRLGTTRYDFDDVNSYRTRLGMRWTRNYDEVRSLYAGIGWDYEFDSKARATFAEYSTATPTGKGSSGFLELGWKSKVTNDHPWGIDVRATGWTGKQEGGTFFATISHSF